MSAVLVDELAFSVCEKCMLAVRGFGGSGRGERCEDVLWRVLYSNSTINKGLTTPQPHRLRTWWHNKARG